MEAATTVTVERLVLKGEAEADVVIRPRCTPGRPKRNAPKTRVCLSIYTQDLKTEVYLRPTPDQAREIAAALVEAANLTDRPPTTGAAE